MKFYVYHNGLRCRCKYITSFGRFGCLLQVQKNKFGIWFNVGEWMGVQEDFSLELKGIDVRRQSYQFGNVCESYKTGKLDIKKRAKEFIEEYIQSVCFSDSNKIKFKELIDQQ